MEEIRDMDGSATGLEELVIAGGNVNSSDWQDYNSTLLGDSTDPISNLFIQAMFYVMYTTIFVLGITGNVLVCYVVMRNKAMQTVTNFFITNLALADILLCALAVPFTPIYSFLQDWIFGQVLCHLLAYSQGVSVYISTLTLMSIAIDRYFVIIYPFKPRMKVITCFGIITFIWIFALLVTLPYGIYLTYGPVNEGEIDRLAGEKSRFACQEDWPQKRDRLIFSYCTVNLQFVLPFLIMAFCYIKVSIKLSDRAKAKPGSKNSKKEAVERERKRRTNRMLIAMVTIFGGCWLPINLVNLWNDVSETAFASSYSTLLFFFAHTIAMSSTCYNPFLYAWLNENFRKEFKQVLPCFYYTSPASNTRSRRMLSERTCNGNETVQETFIPTASQAGVGAVNAGGKLVGTVLEPIEEQTSNSQSVVAVNYEQATAKYVSTTNQVQVHNMDESSPTKNATTVLLVMKNSTGGMAENGGLGCNVAGMSSATTQMPASISQSSTAGNTNSTSTGSRDHTHPSTNSIPLVPVSSTDLLFDSSDPLITSNSTPTPPFNPNFNCDSSPLQPTSANAVSAPSGSAPVASNPPSSSYHSQMNLQITQLV